MTIQNNQITSQSLHINPPFTVGNPAACDTSTGQKVMALQMPSAPIGRNGPHINTTA